MSYKLLYNYYKLVTKLLQDTQLLKSSFPQLYNNRELKEQRMLGIDNSAACDVRPNAYQLNRAGITR